jgi:hypothetical protein
MPVNMPVSEETAVNVIATLGFLSEVETDTSQTQTTQTNTIDVCILFICVCSVFFVRVLMFIKIHSDPDEGERGSFSM